ncbi:tyrosine-type recombinase/integrase [Sinirhodobacter sp. WL0062]|uniref:Tyrosine-type recombinase/integrase n=1 Tax=Rhodobacter flavimaris TaxID=2907145 RepID=A0ABS8YYR4_9RHOB|nr:tyrosine-type recombinase/integrase [Sinirhodobacter sp. WL0062]MCE5974926.1 tyrosine-type recombinase/integrase [Sinirhodobacter sp. WL0062]
MTLQNPKLFDLAFIPEGTSMFSDLIAIIEAAVDLTETRRRDMISGLRRVAKALGRPPQDVPCSSLWLQPRLAKIAPAALNLSLKSWQNAVSDARAAMAHVGIVEHRNKTSDLSPEWAALWKIALASKNPTIRPSLSRFIYFLNGLGVSPESVRDEHSRAFYAALVHDEIRKSPIKAHRNAIHAWNLAVKLIEGWPQTFLILESHRNIIKLDEEALPQSFIRDLDSLMARLGAPDPLAEHGPTRALRPSTTAQYRRLIIRFASELVHSGIDAGEITCMGFILNPVMAERGLRQMLSRTENKTTKQISRMAELLRSVGKATEQPDAGQEVLVKLAKKLSLPPQKGMTRKNRDRLRVLQDERQARRLLNLPERLMKNGRTGKSDSFTKALAHEDALAIAILLICPVRIKNLAGIHLEQHLQRPGDGRVFLVFVEDEVKNEHPLEFELPPDLVCMIDKHLAGRSPTLCPMGTPWLFPRRDGSESVDPNHLSNRIAKRIKNELGFEMNAHLFRHFAVMKWLEANPGAYEVARRLLGHSTVSHTINVYSGLEIKTATKAFSELVAIKKKGPHK